MRLRSCCKTAIVPDCIGIKWGLEAQEVVAYDRVQKHWPFTLFEYPKIRVKVSGIRIETNTIGRT